MPRYRPEHADRPGQVAALRGIIFQNDGQSSIGRYFIRPLEAIDRWIAGVRPSPEHPPLAMHAGLHVQLADGREMVAEQLVGTLYMDFTSGLNWTPLEKFRERDRGGWDLTLPLTTFRGVEDEVVEASVARLNAIEGRPFVGEDCTAFIERALGGRRLFADSPLLRTIGIAARVGDPALPLLRPEALVDERARRLLHADAVKRLPDPQAGADSPNARLWLARVLVAAPIGWAIGHLVARGYSSRSRRSMPASSTARRFFK